MYPNSYGNQGGQGMGFNLPNSSVPPCIPQGQGMGFNLPNSSVPSYHPQGQPQAYPPAPYPTAQGSFPYSSSSGYPIPTAVPAPTGLPTQQYSSYSAGVGPPPAYPTAGGYMQQSGYSQPTYPHQQLPSYPTPPHPGDGSHPAYYSSMYPNTPNQYGNQQGQAPGYPPSPYPSSEGSIPHPHSAGYPVAPAGGAGFHPTQTYPSYNTNATHSPAYPTAGGYPQQLGYPVAPSSYPQHQQSTHLQQSYAPPQQQASQFQQSAYPTHQAPYGSAGSASAMQQYSEVPTLRGGPCDPSADSQVLRKAMKGFGTDEKAIINVLGKRTDAQRQQIAQAFKASYGKDLIKDLKSELSGRLEQIVIALMTPRVDLLAQTLYKAMRGLGTNDRRLIDVLCTSTNDEIQRINASYIRQYGKPVEKDISGDTSGHFGRILVSICAAGRSQNTVADSAMAADDAKKLYNAGEKKWGTDESVFNMILVTRSFAQLRLTFHEYERLTGHSFDKAVQGEFSGDVKTGMLAVVKCARNRAAYFAERIHESVAGMGTRDDDLIFLVVTRADVDLESVKTEYMKMYGRSMADDVKGDTSGDYQKMLLALMGL